MHRVCWDEEMVCSASVCDYFIFVCAALCSVCFEEWGGAPVWRLLLITVCIFVCVMCLGCGFVLVASVEYLQACVLSSELF